MTSGSPGATQRAVRRASSPLTLTKRRWLRSECFRFSTGRLPENSVSCCGGLRLRMLMRMLMRMSKTRPHRCGGRPTINAADMAEPEPEPGGAPGVQPEPEAEPELAKEQAHRTRTLPRITELKTKFESCEGPEEQQATDSEILMAMVELAAGEPQMGVKRIVHGLSQEKPMWQPGSKKVRQLRDEMRSHPSNVYVYPGVCTVGDGVFDAAAGRQCECDTAYEGQLYTFPYSGPQKGGSYRRVINGVLCFQVRIDNVWFLTVPCDHVSDTRACSACRVGLDLGQKKVCKGCKVARYCSKTCQESDWKFHQKLCRKVTGHRNKLKQHNLGQWAK